MNEEDELFCRKGVVISGEHVSGLVSFGGALRKALNMYIDGLTCEPFFEKDGRN